VHLEVLEAEPRSACGVDLDRARDAEDVGLLRAVRRCSIMVNTRVEIAETRIKDPWICCRAALKNACRTGRQTLRENCPKQ
jgi:hypothetical protein